MNHLSRKVIKNLVIAATISLAGFASWALTDMRHPTIDIATSHSHQGS